MDSMSSFGGKADMTFSACMSAFDPKRTFAAAVSKSRKFVKEKIDGGNLAVPSDDEIGSGVSRRLVKAV
jgi:hypothetical protein